MKLMMFEGQNLDASIIEFIMIHDYLLMVTGICRLNIHCGIGIRDIFIQPRHYSHLFQILQKLKLSSNISLTVAKHMKISLEPLT